MYLYQVKDMGAVIFFLIIIWLLRNGYKTLVTCLLFIGIILDIISATTQIGQLKIHFLY